MIGLRESLFQNDLKWIDTNFKLEGNNTISYDAIQDLKKLTHGDQ